MQILYLPPGLNFHCTYGTMADIIIGVKKIFNYFAFIHTFSYKGKQVLNKNNNAENK